MIQSRTITRKGHASPWSDVNLPDHPAEEFVLRETELLILELEDGSKVEWRRKENHDSEN